MITTFKNNFLATFFTIAVLAFLLACGQSNSNKVGNKDQALTIDTFSTFPPEIDGCSCTFSNNPTEYKKGEYIYMNDFARTAFLKINGVLTKFTQTDYKEIDSSNRVAKYKGANYKMTIETKDGIQSGEESWIQTGIIKLTDKKGSTITKTFYGDCGC